MSADPSIRQRVIEEFETRVRRIHGEEFQTNAGHTVFVGEVVTLGPDDPEEAIAIVPLEDEVGYHGKQVMSLWPIEIHALVKASTVRPYVAIERIIADIKRAVELETDGRTMDGLIRPYLERRGVRPKERESGSTTVGAIVPYVVRIVEVWGLPT